MKVVFLEPALQEMTEAARFYEEQVIGLGNHFLDEIDSALSKINDYPHLGKSIDSDIRRFLLTTFPFALLYQIKDDLLIIIAVMHLKRKPNYWKKRKR